MKKITAVIVTIILIITIAVSIAIYLSNNGYFAKKGQYTLAQDSTGDNKVNKYQDGFAVFTGKQLYYYDSSMNRKWFLDINAPKANMYIREKYILIMSLSDNSVFLVKNGKIETSFKTKSNIKSGSVNENGYICISTDEKGYKGVCKVYKPSGKELVTYTFGDKYVVDADISPNNRDVAINTIDITNGLIKDTIIFSNGSTGKYYKEVTTENIIASVRFYGSGKLIAQGKNGIVCYNGKGKQKWNVDYKGNDVKFIKINDGYIAVSLSDASSFGSTEVKLYNLSGRQKGNFTYDYNIDYMALSGGKIAISSENEIVLLNRKGQLLGKAKSDAMINGLELFEKKNRAMVMSGSEINMIPFER
ncbi:MAG: DUF5711 family protein [Bacillota bacterium]|nr:DUF5711 family protein [Bacillota bacterium]